MRTPTFIAYTLSLVLIGCKRDSPVPATTASFPTPLEADLRLVAIDTALYGRFLSPGSMILVRTPTSTHGFLEFDHHWTKEAFIYQLCQPDTGIAQIQRETAENFLRANSEGEVIRSDSLGSADWVRVIDEKKYESYWGKGRSSKQSLDLLKLDYPSATGVVDISAFGWNADHSEGLLYVGSLTTRGHGGGDFYVLRRYGNQYACIQIPGGPTWTTKVNKTARPTPTSRPIEFDHQLAADGL